MVPIDWALHIHCDGHRFIVGEVARPDGDGERAIGVVRMHHDVSLRVIHSCGRNARNKLNMSSGAPGLDISSGEEA